MFKRKWKEVYERLPIERKDKSLTEISGFEAYCTDFSSFRLKVLTHLFAEFGCSQRANVCEVGCGCGDKLTFFYSLGHQCYGIDYSESMIKRGRQEMPGAELHVGDASQLPFPDNSMDFVFSYGVFIYFESWEYCDKALSELYRIAKPKAVICIWDVPDIRDKEKVIAFRGKPEPGYEHTYYDMNDFIRWFKSREIEGVKSEYLFMPEYKHSYYRFNISARLNKSVQK